MRSSLLFGASIVAVLNFGAAGSRTLGADMMFRPVSSTGPYSVDGHEITVKPGAQRVFLEIKIKGFAPDVIHAYQSKVDDRGFSSGASGALAPAFTICPGVGPAGNAFCRNEMNEFGVGTSECVSELADVPLCEPAWINRSQIDWIYYDHGAISVVDLRSPFRWGGVALNGEEAHDGGLEYYAGDLALDIPADARGSFTIGFVEKESFMGYRVGDDFVYIEPLDYVAALIIITCQTAADCDDGNDCTVDACDTQSHRCDHFLLDEVPCDDSDLCTVGDECIQGFCVAGAAIECPVSPCRHPGSCNPQTGNCSPGAPLPNLSNCNDSNPCTTGDRCISGSCIPVRTVSCNNGDQCNEAGQCIPESGLCSAPTPKVDETFCSDGNYCSTGDACYKGTCIGFDVPLCIAWPEFEPCLQGPDQPVTSSCLTLDFDSDGFVDLADVARFLPD